MDYKLAKQLKDAGFPFREITKNDLIIRGLEKWQIQNLFAFNGKDYLEPTLSELIEACGDGFAALIKSGLDSQYKGKWLTQRFIRGPVEYYQGKTPLEAVAKLWLKLNGK